MTPEQIGTFMTAGNATFTVENTMTGNRFTYRVKELTNRFPHSTPDWRTWAVSVLIGPDNKKDFTYIGFIRKLRFQHGNKSSIARDSKSVLAFEWMCNRVANSSGFPAFVHFYPMGNCGRCGRLLTTPESVASGIGPECTRKLSNGH